VKFEEESKTKNKEEDDEDVVCRMGKMVFPVVSEDGSKVEEKEVPFALCKGKGDKIEVRVPDKQLIAKLFPKEETTKKGKKGK
jgi:hypothetical protein